MLNYQQIAATYNLRQHGNRYTGPCPKCGGSERSDKFQLRSDGGYKCYACGFKGDEISWWREIEGKSCPEAFEAAGIKCDRTACAVWDTCRMGRNQGQPIARTPHSVQVPHKQTDTPRTTTQRDPASTWLAWATALLTKAQANLQSDRSTLDYLAGRGIGPAAAKQYGLGTLAHPQKPNRASIGLPPEKNGKTTLWVPGGLVIPTLDAAGLHRLKIRRTSEDRAKFIDKLKYVWVEGSGNAPMLIQRESAAGTIIVEAELDAIACAAAHPGINVIALGTVDMPVTAEQGELLKATPVILVALDADPESAAGQKAVRKWLTDWPNAKAWPVPSGKDPGDYVAAGHQLTPWITAGLPPRIRVVHPEPKQDIRPINLQASTGGTGSVELLLRSVSRHGVEFAVVASEKEAKQASQDCPGVIFFTRSEWQHCLKMTPEEADAAMLLKQTLGGTIKQRRIAAQEAL